MADYYVKTTGSDTTGDGSVGNPYATPGKALGVAILAGTGWRIFVEAGTYPITTTTQNIASGRLNFTQAGTQSVWNRMIGHAVGDITTIAQFTLSVSAGITAGAITTGAAIPHCSVENFIVTGNATAGAKAITAAGKTHCRNFTVSGFTGGGGSLVSQESSSIISDFSINCGSGVANTTGLIMTSTSYAINGVVFGNAGPGISVQANAQLVNVKSYGHTGASGYGFRCAGTSSIIFRNCIAANNGADNFFLLDGNQTAQLFGCIADGGSAYSFGNNSATDSMALIRCAAKAGSSGLYPVTPSILESFSTLSVSPFVNAATGDFRLTDEAKTTLYAAGMDFPTSWLQSLGGGGVQLIGSSLIGRAF